MHATERIRNISRTVMVFLSTVDLGGCVLVPADDATFDSASTPAFVRVRLDNYSATNTHRIGSDPAEMCEFSVIAECYRRNGEGADVVAVDAVDLAAESIMAALRGRSLPIFDRVTDPAATGSSTGHTIRFTSPPSLVAAPAADGWSRRIVTAPGWWLIRHTSE